MTEHAAGLDLRAAVVEPIEIEPGSFVLIPTGLRLGIPLGYEGQVRPRSGLAAKYGITLVNSPGTIDADYRGEVQVVMGNNGAEPFIINRGDRIAQLIVAPVAHVQVELADCLEETERGQGGFGHTGR